MIRGARHFRAASGLCSAFFARYRVEFDMVNELSDRVGNPMGGGARCLRGDWCFLRSWFADGYWLRFSSMIGVRAQSLARRWY